MIRIGALRVLKLGKPQPGGPPSTTRSKYSRSAFALAGVILTSSEVTVLAAIISARSVEPGVTRRSRSRTSVIKASSFGGGARQRRGALLSRRQRMIHVRLPSMTPARSKLEGEPLLWLQLPCRRSNDRAASRREGVRRLQTEVLSTRGIAACASVASLSLGLRPQTRSCGARLPTSSSTRCTSAHSSTVAHYRRARVPPTRPRATSSTSAV